MVPLELPVVPIPPQTEIEPAPRPLTAEILERAERARSERAPAVDRLDISAEARAFDTTRRLVRDALSADHVDPEEVAARTSRTIAESLFPAFRAERGSDREALQSFEARVREGIERGAEESRGRPRPDGAAFEPQRARAVLRLQESLVSFVEAERLVGSGANPEPAPT